jgi:D-arabinose 1-dehydrogenase-like Zn-dependent alcohol dehydrogenase
MKAAQFTTPRCIDVIETKVPEPAENQVRIKLDGCGICGSNLPMWEGREWFKYPAEPGKPGHEGWGTIDEIGRGVTGLQKGDYVTMLSYSAFAEYDVADEHAVLKIPEQLNGKPFPGEPLGCVMNIFKRSGIKKGDTVAIIGIGFLGSLLTQISVKTGAEVIAVSRSDSSLETAKMMGAHHIIKMDDHWRIIEDVKKITSGKFCSHVIEAVGLQWPLDLAGELVSEGGRLIIAGYHQDGPRNVNMQLWNWRGIDVINAHEREELKYIDGIRTAIDAVKHGILTPDRLYQEFSLDKINDAFKAVAERTGRFSKALIRF